MKLISILLLAFTLAGCYQTVSIHDYERAKAKCESIGESVESVAVYFEGTETVKCNKSGKIYGI